MTQFIRCRLKEYSEIDKLVLEKCNDNTNVTCSRPAWLTSASIGAEFIVRFDSYDAPSIKYVLNLQKPQPEKFKPQTVWTNRTYLKARTIIHTLALSMGGCEEHNRCKVIGIHVLDVASFYNIKLDEERDINDCIKKSTGQDWLECGLSTDKEVPCLSFFLHTVLDYSQIVEPESSIINSEKKLHLANNYSIYEQFDPEFDWNFIFKYAWNYRTKRSQPFPEYAHYCSWVLHGIPKYYKSTALIQTYIWLLSYKTRQFLQTRKVPFHCRFLDIKMSEEFELNFMNMLKYSIALQVYYKHVKGNRLKLTTSNDPTRVIVFVHVWEHVMDGVRHNNIMFCCSILAGFHLHPFLVQASHHLQQFQRQCTGEEITNNDINKTPFEPVVVQISRALWFESVLTQKLIIHAITCDDTPLSNEDIGVMSWKPAIMEFTEQSKRSPEHRNHLKSYLSVYGDKAGINVLQFINESEPFHVMPCDLVCYEIEKIEWKKMQKNLSDMKGEFPSRSQQHELLKSVMKADNTKTEITSYSILQDKTLNENIYQGKPVIVQWCHDKPETTSEEEDKQNPWMQIITLSQNIHKCFVHLDHFNRAFPFYEQPNNWTALCSSARYYTNTRIYSTNTEGLYKINGHGYPSPEECKYICATAWVDEDRQNKRLPVGFVFYAHGENIRRRDDPKTSYFRLHTMLRCDEDVLKGARLTLQFI